MQQSMLINTRGRAILVMKTLKDRLIKWWQKVLQPVTVGNNVTLPVPSVDRGREDHRNLMCVVTDINTETQQYKFATRYGLLNVQIIFQEQIPAMYI